MNKWVVIAEFPAYKINNKGEILNTITNKILLGTKNAAGYRTHKLHLYDENYKSVKFKYILTHLYVAKYFIPNPENKPCVNHIDENKMNSNATNLEWVTEQENSNHATRNSRISEKKGKPVCEYDIDGKLVRIWKSAVAVSKIYPVAARSIHDPCTNKKGSCYGRQWRYYEDTLGENIEPIILAKYIQKKKYIYDYDIPVDLLFRDTTIDIDFCIKKLTEIKNNVPMCNYYNQQLSNIIDFLKK